MKIDVTPQIKDWDGTGFRIPTKSCPVCGRDKELSPILTLRSVCLNALGATLPADREAPIEEKMERLDLGEMIYKNDVVDLTAAEIVTLQERANAFYLSSQIAAQAHRLLEPSTEG